MSFPRTCAWGMVAVLLSACGGSGSETPPPVEPTTQKDWERPKADDPNEAYVPKSEDQDEPKANDEPEDVEGGDAPAPEEAAE